MANISYKKPTRLAGRSLLSRLLRPSLGRKFGFAFISLLLVTAGNLFVAERMYDEIADMAIVINESGRLRYMSQEIAYHSTRLVHEKRGDRAALGGLLDEFDIQIGKIKTGLGHLSPFIGNEITDLPGRLETLQDNQRNFRSVVEVIRKFRGEVDAAPDIARVHELAGPLLALTDSIVNDLTRATKKAHLKLDILLYAVLAIEALFILGIFIFFRRQVVLPVRELSDFSARFAAGEHVIRVRPGARDEIGDLGRTFNQTADAVVKLIADLNHSRDFYLELFNGFPDPIWRSGADGMLDYFNQAWLDFTGKPIEHELGEGWAENVHPSDVARCSKVYREAFGKREPFEIEFRMRRADGAYRWLIGRGAPYVDMDGGFAGYLGSCYDITERKESEGQVHMLSLAVEEIGSSVLITDLNGKIEYVNSAFSEATGYSFDEAVGQNTSLLQSGHTPPEKYQEMWDTLLAGNEWRGEMLNRKKDGSLFWESAVISAVSNEAGEMAYFVAVLEDITARKHAETQMHLLSSTIEQAGDSVMIVNSNNIIEYVNPAFVELTSYSEEEIIGKKPDLLRSGRMSEGFYKEMWGKILAGDVFRGELINRKKNGELYYEDKTITPIRNARGEIGYYVSTGRDVTERKNYESELEHQANYDTLTALPNRNLLQDRLGQALTYARRHARQLAVLFLDLDFFKNINDSLGHDAGDLLLKQVAARLTDCVREGDTVARQGGDEFVVILSDIEEEEDVTAVTRKILKAFADPFSIGSHELYVTCSIGIALYPKDGEDIQSLLKNSDAALYRAKEQGRNNSQFYTMEMNVKALERLVLENNLRHALDREQFEVYYQPQVDLRSGEINGMEALLRWKHPEMGMVPPTKFIPMAEESGLIVPIGEWVLRTACKQNKAWQDAGLRPVCVAVNLSARQFRHQDLVALVAGILKETGLDPSLLELELTESLLMQNVEATIDTLTRFKAMGVKSSIDDFGTGYSSLSYLKRFPIDTLKIDQSFVHNITTDPDDAAIAKTIISMAHEMKLRVIAEGVETEEQRSFLHLRHCDEMQGYLFSKPVPAEEFEVLLRERRRLNVETGVEASDQRTLLLLDDEENILTALARLLRRDGYRILKATSAPEAFDLLAENTVGVIVSDQRMPIMSGVEFLHRVKRMYPDTVRMVLSGYTELKSVTDAINEGAVYKFLTKPWDDELLRANIKEAFQRYEMVRDNRLLTEEMVVVNEQLNQVKHQLERRVELKDVEAQRNMGVLQVSQEVFEYMPVGLIGVGEDGLIAMANGVANQLFGTKQQPSLAGSMATECLHGVIADSLEHPGRRGSCKLENGRDVVFWSYSMGHSSSSEGKMLVVVPDVAGEPN